MKAVLIVADGMADWPLKELGGRTPLEVARKPSMDGLAEIGVCGIVDPISPGIAPGSDVAMLALLGYDALGVYSGRGALEALGFGMELSPQDVAFRCNFATVDERMAILDRRAGRIATEEAFELAKNLKEVCRRYREVDVAFESTLEHRAILRLRGPGLSANVSDSDPRKVGVRVLNVRPLDGVVESKRTADVLNDLTQLFHRALKDHPINERRAKAGLPPANVVLFRGAGRLPNVSTIRSEYGVKAAVIAAVPLVKGVCKVAGMDLLNVLGVIGGYEDDVYAMAKAALEALKAYDLILVHFKATDLASHDANVKLKVKMIEKVDELVGHILRGIDEAYVVLTTDHTTSSITREHEGDPVPIAIAGPYVIVDDVSEYSERACSKGGLGRIKAKDVMPLLMNWMGKAKRVGA